MPKRLEHACLVGGAGLLGSALAEGLAARGCCLSLCGLEEEELAALAGSLEDRYAIQVSYRQLDVRDAEALANWIEARHQIAPLDWLIINAGMVGIAEEGLLLESPARSAGLIATNLGGVLNALQPALPLFRGRPDARIVIVASASALIGFSKAPVYAATKAALRALFFSLRPQTRRAGISLSIACPGFLIKPAGPGVATWRPFQISPAEAARRILTAAAAGKAQILFPRRLFLLIRLLSLLPLSWRDRFI
ncbi:MAG: SDR family NAD(P)-dependent oxidoreductase [Pseudomonadota bacterium]